MFPLALLSKPKIIIGVIIFIVVSGYIGWLKLDIVNLEEDVTKLGLHVQELKLDVEREKGEVRKCKSEINITNDRISDLKTDADRRHEVLDMLAENITVFKEVTDQKIKNIIIAPTPENCKQAMEFLRKGIGGIR